jgi:hypothetical protein
VTPVFLVVISAIILAGVALALTILDLILPLLIMNLVYLALLAWVFVDMHRTGNYWNVPYPSQPEHHPRR